MNASLIDKNFFCGWKYKKRTLVCQENLGQKIWEVWRRCLSLDVNCVYYKLKSRIFVEVDHLFSTGKYTY